MNNELINCCKLVQLRRRSIIMKRLLTSNIFITPIAKGYKGKLEEPCSRKDWEEQEKEARCK